MFASPASVLGTWFRGLLAVAMVVAAGWLFYEWYQRLPDEQPVPSEPAKKVDRRASHEREQPRVIRRIARWRPALDKTTLLFTAAVLLSGLSLGGRYITPRLLRPSRPNSAPALPEGVNKSLAQPDGATLHYEEHGAAHRPVAILTHGWGANHNVWGFLQRQWPSELRFVVWDLPGLGRSTQPRDRDFSLENMARDLRAIIDASAGQDPVVLIGHSIGGMTILTLCRLFPELLGSRVKGLILVHTTYTNPLKTMSWGRLMTAIQKPVLEPLLYLQMALSPLVRIMNWMSYLNGSLHWSTARSSFGGTESREQLEFVTQFELRASPAVEARGALGMLAYDATAALRSIHVPVLVIAGDRDPVTLPDASSFIQREIPAAEMRELRPGKHYGFLEHNAEFVELSLEFCRRVLRAERSPQLTMPQESPPLST